MSYTPKTPARGRFPRAVWASAGATCLLLASMAPAMAVDWPQPLPGNEFGSPATAGTHTRIDIVEGGTGGTTNDGVIFRPNPAPTEPSTGTGVFQPFYTVHRSTGSCNSGGRCISYVDPVSGATISDVMVEGGFNTDTNGSSTNYEMTRPSAGWTRSVLMSEFNITPGQAGYIELAFDVNETAAAGSDPNKILLSELQIFIGSDLDKPESSGEGPDGTGYDGGTFDTDASSSPNTLWNSDGTVANAPRWTLDNATNHNVDVLLNASICANNGQCGSGQGDMSVFIPIALLGNFDQDDNFVLYTENLFVDDGYTEVRFRTAGLTNIPEPGTLALLGIGVVGLGYARRRRRPHAAAGCGGDSLPA